MSENSDLVPVDDWEIELEKNMAIRKSSDERKAAVRAAREYDESRKWAMRQKALDALEAALESEEEKLRLEAYKAWARTIVPTASPERVEEEEIIEVTSKATLDEIEAMITRKMGTGGGSGGKEENE